MANLTMPLVKSFLTGRHQGGGDATREREEKSPRVLRTRESLLHAAADSHVPALSVSLRHAFAMGRRALKATRSADAAAAAVKKALKATLVPMLRKVLEAGGEVAVSRLRVAGDVIGHEFHGNQWTDGAGDSLSDNEWQTWADYGHTEINDVLRGKDLTGTTSFEGTKISAEDAARYSQIAKKIDAEASGHVVHNPNGSNEFYRGEVFESFKDLRKAYPHNATITIDRLTPTSVDFDHAKNFAEQYHDLNPDSVKVVVSYYAKNGVLGVPAKYYGDKSPEVVLGRGQNFKVRSITKMPSGYYDVRLMSKDEHPKSLPRVKVQGSGRRALGDVEGHPFHGNQWTGGVTSELSVTRAGNFKFEELGHGGRPFLFHPKTGDLVLGPLNARTTHAEELDKAQSQFGIKGHYDEYMKGRVTGSGDPLYPHGKIEIFGGGADKHTEDETRAAHFDTAFKLLDIFKNSGADKKAEVHGLQRVIPGSPSKTTVGKFKTLEDYEGELRTAKRPDRPRIDFTFDAKSQAAIDWADRHAAELIDGITETSREQISNAIANLLETGDWEDAMDEILNAVGNADRAELIARNESMTAVSEGQRQGWDQAVEEGLLTGDEKRTWITVGDEKVCPICEELDGAVADLDGEYPGDGGDGPPAHVSCRCTEGISG